MLDQMFDSVRRASESSMQLQQEMMRQWAQNWPAMSLNATGTSAEWFQTLQKRWVEFTTEMLTKHRESLDSAYKANLQVLENTLKLSDVKNPEEYRRAVEELWRKNFEVLKSTSESQLREFSKGAEKWFELLPKPKA